MGSFANSVFSILLGWVRGAVSWLWNAATSQESSTFMQWIANNWLTLAVILCAAGVVIDFVVHMFRWQPYKVWASFFRRMFGKKERVEETPRSGSGLKRRVRREWVYADGTARADETSAAEEETAQGDWYQPEMAVASRVSSEDMSQRYVRSFARPEADAYQMPQELERLTYQQELDKQAPVQGLEDYPQPKPPVQPVQQQPQGRTERISKRMARLHVHRFLDGDDEELELRYKPAPPAVDKTEAYREPYYPPQWKRPTDVGASVSREEDGL